MTERAVRGWKHFFFRLFGVKPFYFFLVALVTLEPGCAKIDEIRDSFYPRSPRETYESGLQTAGLTGTAMVRAWRQTAEEALRNPVSPGVPYRETGYLNPAVPIAGAFQIDLTRGQRLVASVSFVEPDTGSIFLDLFREFSEFGLGYRSVATSDSTQKLVYEATTSGTYILRFQPELLAGGRYDLTVFTEASLVFPVLGIDSGSIQSIFGDARDDGRRSHDGVDIFAPRGTPVVAATDGIVSSTRIGGLGGKTVWVRSARSVGNLYYAHLDEQLVHEGDRVTAGDTLGLVGNTGNAITTPPHLHFGIYRNGPVDPFPFVHQPETEPAAVLANLDHTNSWMRTSVGPSLVRAGPSTGADERRSLDEMTSVHILAAASTYFRVQLPDGTTGYISAIQVESEDHPIDEIILAAAMPIQQIPSNRSGLIAMEGSGAAVQIRSRFGDYLRVENEAGQTGWLLDR